MSRILFCSQAAHVRGGVEVWLDDLAAALAPRGWDVHVALAKGRFHDPDRYLRHHPHHNVHVLDGTSSLREGRVLSLLETFKRLRPSIVFPVNLADAMYAAAHWKQQGAETRLVTGLQKVKDDRMLGDLRTCASLIDLATTVSRRVEMLLRSAMPIDPERIVRIPTGVPRPRVESPPRTHLRHLLYVGRLDPEEKRIFDLPAVLQRIHGHDITTHIVGSGPAEEELKRRLTSDDVVFYGDLPRDQLYERLYPRCDALILFSMYEAGPMVAWEAMAHGVVPIVSDFGGREEERVIRDGETGLVFPVGDTATAAQLILGSTTPGALLQLSRNARELLPPEYSIDSFQRRWHEELLRCLELPVRTSKVQLPRQVSPGHGARLRLGLRATYHLRRLIGTRYTPDGPGAEWPHGYGAT